MSMRKVIVPDMIRTSDILKLFGEYDEWFE
jgi:hypothetical protein